jgi:hypothetical protein
MLQMRGWSTSRMYLHVPPCPSMLHSRQHNIAHSLPTFTCISRLLSEALKDGRWRQLKNAYGLTTPAVGVTPTCSAGDVAMPHTAR